MIVIVKQLELLHFERGDAARVYWRGQIEYCLIMYVNGQLKPVTALDIRLAKPAAPLAADGLGIEE